MNRLLPIAFLAAFLAAAPARAEPGDAAPILTPSMIGELTLDELFAKLPENAGSPSGKRIETEILRRFNQSGSDTADLLMAWAVEAMDERNFPLALDVLDQIVMLRPNYAEGWNKRATVYFLMDEYSASLADIRRTLELEPRHFGALSGLGVILEQLERKPEAIRVYKRALEINPQLETVQKSLEELEKETAGQDI
jgi:tetratricopeptide (TPR) repeat protein